MKNLILIIILLTPFISFAQFPGGVAGSSFWLMPEEQDGGIFLNEKIADKNKILAADEGVLNFNPALNLQPFTEMPEFDLGIDDLSKVQIFTVYAPRDSILEKAIWTIHDQNQDALLLTTHRLVDFSENKFLNNLGSKKHQAQINTYQRYIQKEAARDYLLSLGKKGKHQSIPIQEFTGSFAEMIIYERVLSNKEKAKVETYLALKYGIGIDKNNGQSLYTSKDQKIWDVQEQFNFSNNLAGIGRDEGSGLYQKQSGAVYKENIFALALDEFAESNLEHQGTLNDQSFLIWGENEKDLNLEEKLPGQIQKLNKQWLLENVNFDERQTEVKFNTAHLPFYKNTSEIFWLVVDQGGDGTFSMGQTMYFPLSEFNSEKFCQGFIKWPKSKQIFTLAVGPEMIPALWIDNPDCGPQTKGKLHLSAIGGKPPYFFQVKNKDAKVIATWEDDNSSLHTISDIEAGTYHLNIQDSEGLTYEETIFVNNTDALFSSLKSEYDLPNKEELELDASEGINVSGVNFEWILPNGNSVFGSTITIRETGMYLLNINHEGCLSQQKINIKAAIENNFKNVLVFPNPTSGLYELNAELIREDDLTIELINATGTVLKKIELPAKQRHLYQGVIDNPGFYFLRLTSRNSTVTKKIIVHQ